MLENATFRQLDVFPSSGEERETRGLLGPSGRASAVTEVSSFL
jgi:hypothetical protein